MEQLKTLNVAIVGGGPGCKAIMEMIFAEKLKELRMSLIGVASTDPGAVGYLFAQDKGIYTTDDYRDLFKLEDLNMIIELTGSDDVANEIALTKPPHVRLMDHVGARLFWDVFNIEEDMINALKRIEEQRRDTRKRIEAERIAERKRIEEALQLRREQLLDGVPQRNVAIVGGGPGCKAIMDIIFSDTLSQLRMKLIGVASRNPKAVGYLYAEEKGIYTATDYRDLYKLKDLNMIIELTGSDEVANEISRTKPDHVRLMDHVGALVFWDVFYIEEQRIAARRRFEAERIAAQKRIEAERIAGRKRMEEALALRSAQLLDGGPVRNVAVVGGGPGCKAIMDVIFSEKLSQLRMKLIGVASRNPKAVGYLYAKEKGIYTTTDYRDLYKLEDLNMIIELTGSDDVANEISRTKPDHVRLMDHVAALLFWDVFYIEEQRIAARRRMEEERIAERKRAEEVLQMRRAQLLDGGPVRNVAVVGGGPGCKAIMDVIFSEKLSQLRMKLIGVASRNPKAVGYLYAKEQGIYTTTDYRDLYKLEDLNMIIELTGSDEVANEISRTKPDHVRLMDHVAALVFWDVFNIEEQRLAERERSEEATRLAHTELHQIFETSADGMRVIDRDFTVIRVNKMFSLMTGKTKEEAIGKRCYDVFPGPMCHTRRCPMTRILGGEERVEREVEKVRADGTKISCIVTASSFRKPDGELIGIVEDFRDISERKRSEEALRKSEEKYKTLIESSLTGISIHQDGKYVFVNDRFAEIHGYRPEELLGMDFLWLVHPDDRESLREIASKRLKGETVPERYEVRRLGKDGKVIWCEMMAALIEYGGRPAIMGTLIDISERKQAEEALRKAHDELEVRVQERTAALTQEIAERRRAEEEILRSQAMLRAVFDGISDPLVMLDTNLVVKMLNKPAAEYYQVEFYDVLGKRCHEAFQKKSKPCEECNIPLAVLKGRAVSFERKGLIDPDRLEQVVLYPIKEKNGKVEGAIIRISDVTAARFMERQLTRSEKLATLGLLVSGVAHEINNPLAIINEKAGLMKDLLEFGGEFEHRDKFLNLLGSILNSVERSRAITRRFLGFARGVDVKIEDIDLNHLLEEVLGFLESEIFHRSIHVDFNLSPDLPPLKSDKGQLQQVFLNIIKNAVEVVDDGGHVSIMTQLKDGDTIQVMISDDGPGMSSEQLKNLFQPLYTSGKKSGTGLGLFITHGIVTKNLGGQIRVQTEKGKGATFIVDLPTNSVGVSKKEG